MSWDLGRRSVWKTGKRKHSEWKEPYEMHNGAKPLTARTGLKKAKEKALKWTSQTEKKPYIKKTLRRTEPYKMLKRITKPLRRRVLKSSAQRTQTSGTFVKQVVFLTVNHRGPLPLRELHSTGETIAWRDPGGSWACLPPVYDCVWNHTATACEYDYPWKEH